MESLRDTTAAYQGFIEVISGDGESDERPGSGHTSLLQPHEILWWSAVVQLVGTVLFNVNTIDAMSATSR